MKGNRFSEGQTTLVLRQSGSSKSLVLYLPCSLFNGGLFKNFLPLLGATVNAQLRGTRAAKKSGIRFNTLKHVPV